MGWYREQLLPRLIDKTCGTGDMGRLRRGVAAGLHGTVVEVGFGSGLNVPAYPEAVERVHAVEPSDVAWAIAAKRVAASTVPIERTGLDGASLPLDDASCDAALCTFTLCTIDDVEAALAELRRVLRPGGRFHFLEHSVAPDRRVARLQHRLDPWQQRLCDGCHLTRSPVRLVQAAGFDLVEVEARYGGPKSPWSWLVTGAATAPA
ncbi:MAG: class I SAM-dependent methyltransferase [Acidimicrobiales bacterium]